MRIIFARRGHGVTEGLREANRDVFIDRRKDGKCQDGPNCGANYRYQRPGEPASAVIRVHAPILRAVADYRARVLRLTCRINTAAASTSIQFSGLQPVSRTELPPLAFSLKGDAIAVRRPGRCALPGGVVCHAGQISACATDDVNIEVTIALGTKSNAAAIR